MAAPQNKRKMPAKATAVKDRKRRKMESEAEEVRSKMPKVPKPPPSRNVRLDDLAWKEVEMPDRMEDFEGFFGLEEIDDVDVVKEGNVLSFKAVGDQIAPKAQANKAGKAAEAVDAEEGPDGEDASDGEEWGGFGDEAPAEVKASAKEVPKPAPQDDQKPGPKDDQKPKKEKKVKPTKAEKAKAEKASFEKAKAEKAKLAPKDDVATTTPATAFATLLEDDEQDDGVDISAWRDLKLSAETLSALSKLKFAKPSPIQRAAIPEALAGHDVIGKASTGSGKTLAFGIPIVERFLEIQATRKAVKKNATASAARTPALALILAPTRELAHQITHHFEALCAGLDGFGPRIATLTGGLSLLKQQRLLKDADVVIGTPGRMWEIISGGHGILKWLKQIQFLVIDEADRLLSTGSFKEVEDILNVLEKKDEVADAEDEEAPEVQNAMQQRQTLVFSATFHKGLSQKLSGKSKAGGGLMNQQESMQYLLKKLKFREEKPKFIDVNPIRQMAAGLKEGMVECGGTEKDLYLYALLLLHPNLRTLIFTNSISAVRRLTPFLQNLQLPVLPLHSQMVQKARLRSIERFSANPATTGSKKTASILVATDVAARGLDIPHVQLVIHYHLPRTADSYVHRSGRTARAGESGSSILICAPEEVQGTRRLVAKVHANSAAAADEDQGQAAKNGYFIRSLDIDRRVVSRLKPRAVLAKQLADTVIAKEKKNSSDDFLRQAAEDLGVDYDSEEFQKQAPGKRGRGTGREKKEKEARNLTKDDTRALRYELNDLLKQRVNVGVSERYLTSGGIDIDALLQQDDGAHGEFLGAVGGIGLE